MAAESLDSQVTVHVVHEVLAEGDAAAPDSHA